MSSAPRAATDTMGLRPLAGVTVAIMLLLSVRLMTMHATIINVPETKTFNAEVNGVFTSTRSMGLRVNNRVFVFYSGGCTWAYI